MGEAADVQRGSERLGRYIRQLRRGYGYTLRRVEEQSEEFGSPIDNSQLSRFEKGKAAPSFDKLRVLARVFNVPVQAFSDVLDLQQYDALKPGGQEPEALFQSGREAYRRGDYGHSYVIFDPPGAGPPAAFIRLSGTGRSLSRIGHRAGVPRAGHRRGG